MPNTTSASAPSSTAERYVLVHKGEDAQAALFRDWAQNAHPSDEEQEAFDAMFDWANANDLNI